MAKRIDSWEMLADRETGRLVSAMPADRLRSFESVELRDGRVIFSGRALPAVRPPQNLLERFLLTRTDADVIRFARRFGPMLPLQSSTFQNADFPHPRESIDKLWRRFHWEFGFLLTLAAELKDGSSHPTDPYAEYEQRGIRTERPVTLSDLGRATPRAWDEHHPKSRLALTSSLLLQRASYLVRSGELRPALAEIAHGFGKVRFNVVFQDGRTDFGISLLGALTAQFLAAATGSGFANCSGCGRMFVPKRRRPAFGKRRYCDDCGRQAAIRDAKADHRSRVRAEKEAEKARGTK